MAFEDNILLKLKRQYTQDEAVQQLLQMVSQLELEVGMLKSELAESEHKIQQILSERTMTRKQWLKDDLFKEVAREMEILKKRVAEHKKSMEDWRYKYFNLLAATNKSSTKNTTDD